MNAGAALIRPSLVDTLLRDPVVRRRIGRGLLLFTLVTALLVTLYPFRFHLKTASLSRIDWRSNTGGTPARHPRCPTSGCPHLGPCCNATCAAEVTEDLVRHVPDVDCWLLHCSAWLTRPGHDTGHHTHPLPNWDSIV